MSVRLNPVSRSITFGRTAEPSPSIEKTAKNPSFLEWIGQKLPISNQADDLITAYQGEVIPHRSITPEEREILQNAAQNWTPLAGGAEKAIVPPNRAGSVAAHGLTAATTIGGAAAGQFVPSAETDLLAIDNFVWHKTPPVDAALPSALPPAPGTGVLNEGTKVLTDQVQEQVINKHWHLHWPWEPLPASPPVDPVDLGKTVGAAGLGTLGATKTTLGTLATAKTGAALTGWGLGASAGLGVGIVSSLIVAPLIALSQHVQNRNIMEVMAQYYDNPPEVAPSIAGEPSVPPPKQGKLVIPAVSGNPFEALIQKIQKTTHGWMSQLPPWLPISNDPSGLIKTYQHITDKNEVPAHIEKDLKEAAQNFWPRHIWPLNGSKPRDLIVPHQKAALTTGHGLGLLGAVGKMFFGTAFGKAAATVVGGVVGSTVGGIGGGLGALLGGWGALSAWGAKIAAFGASFGAAAGTGAAVVGAHGVGLGIGAGIILAPLVAIAQSIRNHQLLGGVARVDTKESTTTPTLLQIRKEIGPFNDDYKATRGKTSNAFTGGSSVLTS